MIEHMGERNQDEPDERHQRNEDPDTAPPAHAWDELAPRKFAAFERELDGLSGQTMEDQ